MKEQLSTVMTDTQAETISKIKDHLHKAELEILNLYRTYGQQQQIVTALLEINETLNEIATN